MSASSRFGQIIDIGSPSPPPPEKKEPSKPPETIPHPQSHPIPLPHPAEGASSRPPLSMGRALSLINRMGFDDLLILGLILLLAGNDEGSDILPFLALLLFCG